MQPQIEDDSDDNRLIDLFRENPGKELLTDLWIIQDLRKAGALEQAERILRKSIPSPAVGDELRKICSTRARAARRDGNWPAVIAYLESYLAYKEANNAKARKFVNQGMPDLTNQESRWLEEARAKTVK